MSDQDQPPSYWFHILGGSIPFSVKLSPSEFISAVKHHLVTGHHDSALEGRNSNDLALYIPSNLSQDPLDDLDGRAQQAQDARTEAKVNKTLSQLYPEGPPPGHIHFLIRMSEADPENNEMEPISMEMEPPDLIKTLTINLTKLEKMDAAETRPNSIGIKLLNVNDEIEVPSGSIKCEAAQSLLVALNKTIDVPKVRTKLPDEGHAGFGCLWALKRLLGDNFNKHFHEMDMPPPLDSAQLASFFAVGTAYLGEDLGFADDYGALGSEACFTALIADPALRLIPGYIRGKDACRMIVNLNGVLGRWTPRNDFQIGYGKDGAQYGLLHGETISKGEDEYNAVCKMAVMSLHSYNVTHLLSGKDHAILNVYVSEKLCTMYIFHRNPESTDANLKPRFLMYQIVRYVNPWTNPDRTIGFLRRLYNFAAQVKPVLSNQQQEEQLEKVGLELKAAGSQSKSKPPSQPSKSGPPAKRPRTSGGIRQQSNHLDVGTQRVLETQYGAVHHTDKAHIFKLGTVAKRFCAKWTRSKSEIELLQRLHRLQQGHVIPIVEVIPLPVGGTLLVMPLRTPLSLISSKPLTLKDYLVIRKQLIMAIAFLHSQHVAHCDIKPDNIVLQRPTSPFGKLCMIDFGNAVDLNTSGGFGFHGTPGYTAPEVLKGKFWDAERADVWAMANVLSEILGRKDSLLTDCLSSDPQDRPSARHVLGVANKLAVQARGPMEFVFCQKSMVYKALSQIVQL